jgi:TIR domain
MAKTRSEKEKDFRVFVSHSSDDIWVAGQIARCIEECGASAFLDRRDIAAGDDFRVRVREEVLRCEELLALFTPWSRRRAWVRHEIGMADALGKRIVCVFYKVTTADFDPHDDGLGPLSDLNVIGLNDLDKYFHALKGRTR